MSRMGDTSASSEEALPGSRPWSRRTAAPATDEGGRPRGSRAVLYRPVWLLTVTVALLLLLMMSLFIFSSWRNVQELEPVHRHLTYLAAFENSGEEIRELLVAGLGGQKEMDFERLEGVVRTLGALRDHGYHLSAQTPALLAQAEQQLRTTSAGFVEPLNNALDTLRRAHFDEIIAHEYLLRSAAAAGNRAWKIALLLAASLVLFSLPLLLYLRSRILTPLGNLSYLMGLLGRKGYTSAPTAHVDPMLRPLFERYNAMVQRLMVLEDEHRNRERSLRREVRAITKMVLLQQRQLARSERLAAVGEVAASVAHELRNPIAGIQMALSNLRAEITDSEHKHRLELIDGELKRVTRQLNGVLRQSAQTPEQPVAVDLEASVSSLLGLARHQLSEAIRVFNQVPTDLRCMLPEGPLRQALLNLVLNASQALGDSGGHIWIGARQEDDTLELWVEDDGPGFPAELLRSGVRAFASWSEGGTGLGLSMVRRFAHELGGEFSLHERQGGGARALLSLPYREVHG